MIVDPLTWAWAEGPKYGPWCACPFCVAACGLGAEENARIWLGHRGREFVAASLTDPRVDPEAVIWFVPTEAPAAPEAPPADYKQDAGKPRWDLLPLGAVSQIVAVLTFGAVKYPADDGRGWQRADPEVAEDRYYAALLRHLVAWRSGEATDPESGLHHLAHAGACLLFLLWFVGYRAGSGRPLGGS